jgi:cytochrome c oxidase cbb3-type subunit 3
MRFRPFIFKVPLVVGLIGCDREKRNFRDDPSMAASATSVQFNAIVPGLPPTTQPGVTTSVPVDPNVFERNAFNLNEGQRLFTQMNCATCHAAAGGGDIGPTLTDDTWIYGLEAKQICASIIEGRPNGMPAYGPRLSQTQVWQLAAFVRSLSGLVPKTIAPSRDDNIQKGLAPNSTPAPATEHSAPSSSAGKSEGSK